MAVSRMTSKGQITVPKEVRRQMGLRPGDQVEFVQEDGTFRLRKKIDKEVLAKWRGYLKDHLGGKTTDELIEEMRGPRLRDDE
jgi:AbrB family looped-hinge helix DNA binding protein